jgi:hypothetical protein
MKGEWLPNSNEIKEYPQLAILAALCPTLNATINALIAANPCNDDEPVPFQKIKLYDLAYRVIYNARHLESAVEKYRVAIDKERKERDWNRKEYFNR